MKLDACSDQVQIYVTLSSFNAISRRFGEPQGSANTLFSWQWYLPILYKVIQSTARVLYFRLSM